MNVVILAGGLGTRLAEETEIRPKPMVEIGPHPILWHIMKHYDHFGFRRFLLALGYKGEMVKRYFLDQMALSGSMTVDFQNRQVVRHTEPEQEWSVDLIDTGHETNTGGRVKRLAPYLRGSPFLMTYGDGVSNVDLKALLDFHRRTGCLATMTAVRPPARFGNIEMDGDRVSSFAEKPNTGEGWINGGFMVIEPEALDLITRDDDSFEKHALEPLARLGKLAAYRHEGFWQCMDTLRDKRLLESLWASPNPPWKFWD